MDGVNMDLLMHLLVPFTVLKTLFRLETRYLVALLPFAVIMDFDRFFGLKKLSNSLAFVVVLAALVYLVTRHRADNKKVSFIAGFYLLSHLVLDLGGPMPVFWPLDPTFYTLKIYFTVQNGWPVLWWEILTETVIEQTVGSILWTSSFGLIALLAVVYAFREKIRAAVG